MPVLGALAGIGLGIVALSNFTKGGGNEGNKSATKTNDDLYNRLGDIALATQQVHSDLVEGKIAVYIDGFRVDKANKQRSQQNSPAGNGLYGKK